MVGSMEESMIIEPFGHKCLFCGEEVTGVCVIFKRVKPETPYRVFGYTHPECFRSCIIIPGEDIHNDNNADLVEHVYTPHFHYSYYGRLS